MYQIRLNKIQKNFTLKKVQKTIQLVQVGRRGPQGEIGPQGPQGIPGDPASNIVTSVNTQIGDVVLDAGDVGADPAGTAATIGATKVDKTTTVNGHALDSDVVVPAYEVPFTPDVNFESVNVQDAITELRGSVTEELSLKEDLANKSASTSLGTSDTLYPTQKAVKAYVDNAIGGIPSDAVTSVFGRTGIIVSQGGDYTASQITNVPAGNISATNVQAALNELDTEKEPALSAGTSAQYYRGDKTWQTLNTSVVPEGSNLYFTDARAQAAIATGGLYVLKAGDTMTGTLTGRSLEPSANLTYNLGTTNYYAELRARRAYFNATSYIDGTSAGIAALNGSLTIGSNLTVSGTSNLATVVISTGGTIPLSITSIAASGSGSGAGIVALSNDGAALASGDRMGFMLLGGNYDATSSYNSTGLIGYTTELWSSTARGSRLTFEVTTNGTIARTVALELGNDKNSTFYGQINQSTTLTTSTPLTIRSTNSFVDSRFINDSTGSVSNQTNILTHVKDAAGNTVRAMQLVTKLDNITALARRSYIGLTVYDTDVQVAALEFFGRSAYFSGIVRPGANLTYDLGTTSAYWSNVYAQRNNFNSTAYMDGAVAGTINIGAGSLGILATGGSATHSLTLGSTATGIALYNTSDQTTNYERYRIFWSANQLNISNEVGGTGASRSIRINVYSGGLFVNASSSATQGFVQASQNSGLGGQGTFSVNGALTASSGIQYAQIIAPTYTQTSTASGIDLLINRTETSVGSGNQRFIDMQVAGVSKAFIANNGRVSGLDFVASTNFRSVNGGLGNDGTFNNASVMVPTTGTTITRNIADANPALIVNNVNATSTGNILTLQAAGVTKASFSVAGVFFPVQAPTASAPTYVKGGVYFDTTLNKLRVGGATAWETITSA
jgi:hypothetical protein